MAKTRIKTWVNAETLTHTDLNAEYDNLLSWTPAELDDESANAAAQQATTNPASALPTTLQGEIQGMRYLIKAITGQTYWYTSPASSINSILTSVSAITSSVSAITSGDKQAVKGQYRNLTIANNATHADHQLDLTAGELYVQASGGDSIKLSNVSITIDIDVSGASGLDAGSVAANTWYYPYVVYNNTTKLTCGILSSASASPTTPSGYTYDSGPLGAVRTGAAAAYDFITISQKDARVIRESVSTSINSGASGTPASFSMSAVIPATAKAIMGYLNTGASGTIVVSPVSGLTGKVAAASDSGSLAVPFTLPVTTPQTIWGYPESANGTLYTTGWEY